MKIEELPLWFTVEMGDKDCPAGPFVAKSDIPPKRDAKTDPPDHYDACVVYWAVGPRFIAYYGVDRVWRYESGEELLPQPTHWSEILHW